MRETERNRIREVLCALLPELQEYGVKALEWQAGEDWAGDPAVWIWVVLPADAEEQEFWAFENRQTIRRLVRDAFERAGLVDLLVYTVFRSTDEDRAREDLEILAA